MLDELTHPSLDFLRVVNGVILGGGVHVFRDFSQCSARGVAAVG
jgi:hypothetical protein